MSDLKNKTDVVENEKVLYIRESSARLIKDVFQLLNTLEVRGMPNVVTLGLTLQQFEKILDGISEVGTSEEMHQSKKKDSGLLK